MAALPYMQLYVADYLADTMHLTTEQHGAYLLLLFNYWQRGKALPDRKEYLATVARLSNERWQSVEDALKEFFVVKDGHWKHPRVEADLDHMASKQEKAAIAGRASAQSRKRKNQIKSNVRSTDVETDVSTDVSTESQLGGNHSDTYTDPDADIRKEEDFDAFWKQYPNKVNKVQARKSWGRLTDRERRLAHDKLAAFIANLPEFQRGSNFNLHASTYLNQKRWTDLDEKNEQQVSDYMRGMQ